MPKIEQLNESLRKEIATIIEEIVEFPDGLITVMRVECDPNFFTARVDISVLPDNVAGSALETLRKMSGQIAGELKGRVRLRKMPHLSWKFDPTEKKADVIEKAFNFLAKEKELDTDDLEEVKYN